MKKKNTVLIPTIIATTMLLSPLANAITANLQNNEAYRFNVSESANHVSSYDYVNPDHEFSYVEFKSKGLPSGASIAVYSHDTKERYVRFNIKDGTQRLPSIKGTKISVTLTLPHDQEIKSGAGLTVSKVHFYNTEVNQQSKVVLGGTDERKNLECYKGTDIYLYGLSSVAMHDYGLGNVGASSSLGSGSSIGSGNAFLSNNHVVGGAGMVKDGYHAYFNDRLLTCDEKDKGFTMIPLPIEEVILTGRDAASSQDYSVFKVKDFDYRNSEVKRLFGGLAMGTSQPEVGTPLSISQGYWRSITATEIDDKGTPCTITNFAGSTTEYNCDTSGGSSGSPVVDARTGEIVAVHYAATSYTNIGVSIMDILKDYPQLGQGEYTEQVLPTGKPVEMVNATASRFVPNGAIRNIPSGYTLSNGRLKIKHRPYDSLVYVEYFNEKTNEVMNAEDVTPIKFWLEDEKGQRYPLNATDSESETLTLKYEFDYAQELHSRAWIVFDVLNKSGDLVEHQVMRLSTQWEDVSEPPFDVNEDVLQYSMTIESTKDSEIKTPAESAFQGVVGFYPSQHVTTLTPHYIEGHNTIPVVMYEKTTGKSQVIKLQGTKWHYSAPTVMETTFGWEWIIPEFGFKYIAADNQKLKVGNYEGFLPLRKMLSPEDQNGANILISIDLEVKQPEGTIPPTELEPSIPVNIPPVVTLDEISIDEKSQFNVIAKASDEDGDLLTYEWFVPEGFQIVSQNQETVTLIAPEVDETKSFEISVSVNDGEATVTAKTTVQVKNIENSGCGSTDPEADNYPAWDASTVYTNETVSHKGLVYTAKWWTQGNEPSPSADMWKLESQVRLDWDPSVAYLKGDKVNHDGHIYEAKWWTKGNNPASSDVWMNIGSASCK